MGKLWELSQKIDAVILERGLDRASTRGKIALKAGVIFAFDKNTPDDPTKIAKIKQAARDILGVFI